jgi:hypothetical protein
VGSNSRYQGGAGDHHLGLAADLKMVEAFSDGCDCMGSPGHGVRSISQDEDLPAVTGPPRSDGPLIAFLKALLNRNGLASDPLYASSIPALAAGRRPVGPQSCIAWGLLLALYLSGAGRQSKPLF